MVLPRACGARPLWNDTSRLGEASELGVLGVLGALGVEGAGGARDITWGHTYMWAWL